MGGINQMLNWQDWQERAGLSDPQLEKLSGVSTRSIRRLRAGGVPCVQTMFLLIAASRRHPIPPRDPRRRPRSIDFETFDTCGSLDGG